MKPFTHADARPRIHIRATARGASCRHGFHGREIEAPDEGEAVRLALAAIDHAPAVIIWEGRENA